MTCSETKLNTTSPTGLTEDSVETVHLRPAAVQDAPALALVGGAAFLEAFTWMLPGADIVAFCAENHTAACYARYLALPDTHITLAETSTGAPVGYAMLTAPDLPSLPTSTGDIELKRIYLLSRFRSAKTPVLHATGELIPSLRAGQGLMDAAIAAARAAGRSRLLLGTHAGNRRAIGFYRRNGFVNAGTRTFQVGTQCCCDLIMALAL